ncbi:hypothetical protein BKA70DRAFT_1447702 [Coprinopsis sp. MPI-PUGE-AT-0042]|nr:hypothetical protein BKA70DRAFT_1447702 [Coprinopsis sp. MPI-PUGE-AT-0042]
MSPNSGPVKLEEGAIKSEPSSAPCIAQGESEDWGSRVDGARGSVAKLQPSTVIEPERYREETLSLAGCLARYIAEGDDVAFQIGCLLLQVIERIKYLVSVQASQKAVDMAINRVLDHAFSRGIIVDYPTIDDETSARPTGSSHDRSQAEQLGFAFSTNPAVLSSLVSSLWSL